MAYVPPGYRLESRYSAELGRNVDVLIEINEAYRGSEIQSLDQLIDLKASPVDTLQHGDVRFVAENKTIWNQKRRTFAR